MVLVQNTTRIRSRYMLAHPCHTVPMNDPINDPQHSRNTNDLLVKFLEMTIKDSHSLMVVRSLGLERVRKASARRRRLWPRLMSLQRHICLLQHSKLRHEGGVLVCAPVRSWVEGGGERPVQKTDSIQFNSQSHGTMTLTQQARPRASRAAIGGHSRLPHLNKIGRAHV